MSSVPPLLAIDVSRLNNSFNVISFISSNPSIKHFHHFYTSPGIPGLNLGVFNPGFSGYINAYVVAGAVGADQLLCSGIGCGHTFAAGIMSFVMP